MNLSDFTDYLDLDDDIMETDYATVGGWATEEIGAMPVPFDSFDFEDFTIMVKEVDDNHHISRLLILKHDFEQKSKKANH